MTSGRVPSSRSVAGLLFGPGLVAVASLVLVPGPVPAQARPAGPFEGATAPPATVVSAWKPSEPPGGVEIAVRPLPASLGFGGDPFGFRRVASSASLAGPRQAEPGGASPARATLFSAVLPGAGQHLLGQNRKWVYLALEATGWFFYLDRRSKGNDLAVAYRDFAWVEARIQSGERVDGDFDYYEKLTQWQRSGLFDADPSAAGVQPETDPDTYNGSIWELATGIFLPDGPEPPASDPRYQRALQYYAERGYGTEFLWDWTGTGEAQEEYGDLISASDERYRQATNALGAIIANHVVSAVDAYLSSRGVPTPSEIRVAPTVAPSGDVRWVTRVRLDRLP
ncbi:MAG: hypothetical protein AMS19_11225 [Gemmatimonas sp. SG8_23]|nr:MAG: hypothetical protein AMS19_11225 [Gemmatimonas sp. SG8_23]